MTVRGDVFGSGTTEGSSREQRERDGGDGGPNLEFGLSGAIELETPGVALASVDTDGQDGGTEVAGALVDDETVGVGESDGGSGEPGGGIDLDAARGALADNDSFGVLTAGKTDCAIRTGPTDTNVNDLRVLVVEDS